MAFHYNFQSKYQYLSGVPDVCHVSNIFSGFCFVFFFSFFILFVSLALRVTFRLVSHDIVGVAFMHKRDSIRLNDVAIQRWPPAIETSSTVTGSTFDLTPGHRHLGSDKDIITCDTGIVGCHIFEFLSLHV